MGSRLDLHSKLEELLESKNVYYQPPSSIKMTYPAIVYSKTNIQSKFANNRTYLNDRCYELVVISNRSDLPVIDKILSEFSHISYSRHYIADNLHHDVLTLYY